MATQASTKVRLVRCPKCRQVLAELPDVRLYKCGGCGTVLQAKTRNVEVNRSESTDSVANVQQDNAPEEGEARSSNHDLSSLQNGDSLKENGDIDHQYEHLDSKTASPEGNSCEAEDSTAEVKEPSRHDDEAKERASDTNHDLNDHTGVDNSEVGESQRLCQEPSRHDDEAEERASETNHDMNDHTEADNSEVGESPQRLCQEPSRHDDEAEERALETNHDLDDHTGVDNSEVGESQRLCQEPSRHDDEAEERASETNHDLNDHTEADNSEVGESQKLCQEPSRHDDEAEERASETNHDLNDHTEADNSEIGESQRLCQEGDDVVDRDENIPENGHQENDRPSSRGENGEGRLHRYVSLEKEEKACSADENGGLHGEVGHFGLESSPAQILSHDNANASQLAERSKEVDGDLEKKLSASFEDSSVESHDYGHLYRPMRKFRQNFGSASSVSTLGSSPPVKRPTSKRSIRHGDVRSNFPTTRNYYGYDGSESSYEYDQSPQRVSHPSRRNGTTVQKLDAYSLHATLSSEPGLNYSNLPFTDTRESPSIYKRNLIPRHPGFRSLDDKPDEMELLRTVEDLKNQLNRIQILRSERQIYADASPPRYHHLHNQERRNVSRLAFSGEAAHFRHQINCSCLHCCPQDLHRSAQLPSGYCEVHTHCNHCNVSSFSTPGHYTSSELSPWTHEMQIDDLRHRDREMQRLLREKYHTARRHIRPMAGGAPVVPCYHCSELLQLPAEFLLSKKRYHQLKCGACGKMLSFSLLRNKHIVPHLPEADNQRNFGSMSDSSQHVDHVSRDQSDRNKNRKMSSGSSYDLTRDTRMKSIMNKDMDLVESYGSVGASSGKSKAASSESEKMKALPDSRLHRLMGYGSARHVLNK